MPSLPSRPLTVIAHVDMNTFFVSVERLKDPSLEGKPVVVGGEPGRRSVVSSASYEARRYGIHSAMPMTAAVRRCPDLIVVPPNFHDYQQYHQQVKAILADFTPTLEMTSIDEGYLDLTGTEQLWGPPAATGQRIRQRILAETALPASIGISSNKLVSKVASDLAKPTGDPRRGGASIAGKGGGRTGLVEVRHPFIASEGVIVVPPGAEAAFLAPLPLSHLPGCGKMTLPRLQTLGLGTIGELAARDEAELVTLFGEVGRLLWQRANGQGSQTLETERQRKSISKETTFAEDVQDLGHFRSVLHHLIEEISAKLRRRGEAARTVTLKLRYANFETHTFSRSLQEPANTTAAIFEAAGQLLKTNWSLKRPVRLIGVSVSNLMKGQVSEWFPSGQEDLFDQESQAAARRIAIVDEIRERFGKDSLVTGESLHLLKKDHH
ncbi:MAG: hypothetical protein ACETWG_13030 [Candidatus Neomarinimicrobiota bacterium]